MNLGNLVSHRSDILKAEIGSLFILLNKTSIDKWKKIKVKKRTCLQQIDYFPTENNFGFDFEKFIKDIGLDKISFQFVNRNMNIWDDFLKDWRKASKDIQKILSRGCENVNSGIDKGSPDDCNQLKELWIANAFGSFSKIVDKENLDGKREQYKDDLKNLISTVQNNSFYDFEKNREKICKIFNDIYEIFYNIYNNILSDSRFPVNDVTLWEQAYMTASMFKATLAGLYLDNSKDGTGKTRLEKFLENPQTIKWSILGIQYDKLGLAEKGLKAASIQWYRNASEKVDEAIKKVIEIEYPLGNEVYRDETGIYFVVAKNIKKDKKKKNDHFYKLHDDLSVVKTKIQDIFADKFGGEIYPAIFLTEPSRGLMNLGHLVEEARKNFLKAEIPGNFKNYLRDDLNPNGICQICGMRLAHKDNKENLICNVCLKRQRDRIKNWFKYLKEETIWTDELQDKNGRIALITLKFELDKWTNGDLVNSLLVRNEDFHRYKAIIKSLIILIKEQLNKDEVRKLDITQSDENRIKSFLSLFDENSIQKAYDKCFNPLKRDKSIENIDKEFKYIAERLLKEKEWLEHFSFWDNDTNQIWNNRKKGKKFTIDSYDANAGVKNHLYKIFAINYLILQIKNVILERSIGSRWEEFIKDNLSDKTAIDFNNRKIGWNKLNNDDIDFLSQLLLQFLLRKNPSPARLRRIWETTRKFFEDLEAKITELAGIPEERRKRLVWNNVEISNGSGDYKEKEFTFNKLVNFWIDKDGKVYLISSLLNSLDLLKANKTKNDKIIQAIKDNETNWIKKELQIKPYEDTNNNIELKLKKENKNIEIQPYKPYFTILSPTPISWQFIIPAEYVPNLIENVQKEYYKNFKWVYGKLPLHIGIVVQDYKKPLYVGIKALRRIRRDKQEWKYLGKDISAKDFKARQKEAFHYQKNPEQVADCENFYSLFERADGTQKRYEFYLYPDKNKVWIDTTQDASDTDKFYFYRNTFDFEFLDTNVRRNDIFYKKAKRTMTCKQNRPYDIEDWQYFKQFRQYFKDKKTSSKLHKLVSLIYSKLEDWKDDPDAIKTFMLSAFINILELNQGNRDIFAGILGLKDWDEFKNLEKDKFIKKLYMFLDMFEFWHTTLKEV